MDFVLHPLEIFAVLCNVAYVILAARENVWCWPLGIVGSGSSIALFISAQLYAEAVLFVFYVIMGIYGWMMWSRKGASGESASTNEKFQIKVWPIRRHIVVIIIGTLLAIAIGIILKRTTDAQYPLLDSFTTVFSILTTWMVAKKLLENWIYWIVLNSLSVFLYYSRDLQLYAMLSIVYTAMSIYGFVNWQSDYKKQVSL